MKITSIKQQIKHTNRYSVYVDDEYSFSLSETALLESKINRGQELTRDEVDEYKKLSADDKLYAMALRYVAMRTRSTWEVEFYLQRKDASPVLIEQVLNKLSTVGLLDDDKYAQSFVHDRQLLRPASRRKIYADLKKKRIAGDIIDKVLNDEPANEQTALLTLIGRKRRQTKYQDDEKLMQYLARQGFRYDDIKAVFNSLRENA